MKGRFILNFPPESSVKPITYFLIKDYNLKMNILRAEFTAGKEGHLLVEIEAEEVDFNKGMEFVNIEGITVSPLSRKVSLNKEECVHCGACTSVCFSGALEMDRNTCWELLFMPEKCVACELCVKACPLGLITINFGEN